MKLTMPHMGNCYIAAEALFNEMGHEVIVPPLSSKKTLDLGTKYSPETACLPLKLNVGNFLEAIEMGAEIIIMIGGRGPCRLGYYAAVEQEILRDLGIQIDFIILEHPRDNFHKLQKQLRILIAKKGIKGLFNGLRLAWEKLGAIEELERTSHVVRPREIHQGETSELLKKLLLQLRMTNTIAEIRKIRRLGLSKMQSLAVNREIQPLKIGIVGEIYTILESFANLNLEERLGDLKVEVTRTVNLVDWIKEHLILSSIGLYSNKHLLEKAAGYLHSFVGGHGLESVARTVMLAEADYHGVIHILPFTCMPEIIVQGALLRVSSDYKIPVITLVVDEHTGEMGFQTRLEAFVELIARRLEAERHADKTSLSGC